MRILFKSPSVLLVWAKFLSIPSHAALTDTSNDAFENGAYTSREEDGTSRATRSSIALSANRHEFLTTEKTRRQRKDGLFYEIEEILFEPIREESLPGFGRSLHVKHERSSETMTLPFGDVQDGDIEATLIPGIIVHRLLALTVLGTAVFAYYLQDYDWKTFVTFVMAPDLGLLGFIAGPRLGHLFYNKTHSKILSTMYILHGIMNEDDEAIQVGLIWMSHIWMDVAIWKNNPPLPPIPGKKVRLEIVHIFHKILDLYQAGDSSVVDRVMRLVDAIFGEPEIEIYDDEEALAELDEKYVHVLETIDKEVMPLLKRNTPAR